MSLYGLSICPILKKGGFWLGCSYSTFFVVVLNLVNILFIYLSEKTKILQLKTSFSFIFTYLFSNVVSIFFLIYIFKINLITDASRGPQVLITASLLLGLTQYYGMSWIRKPATYSSDEVTSSDESLSNMWFEHIFKISLPIIVLIITLLTFIFRQSVSWNYGRVSTTHVDDVVKQTTLLVFFLIFWLVTTYIFYFLSEKDQLKKIEHHFSQIINLNFNYFSNSHESWGIWKAFLKQLNNFSKLLSQKNMLLKNFSKFVSESVATKAINVELDNKTGQQRELTVISTDIRDFTKISHDYPAETVVTILNQYFETVLNVFTRNHIVVDKFIGDGILSYVELPDSQITESNNYAVKACIDLQEQLEILNSKLVENNLPALRTGIGIYRGPLILGLIGAKDKIQYTIIGDSVNRATRLEGLTKELSTRLIITEEIFKTLEESIKQYFQSAGLTQIRGVDKPVSLFKLKNSI